MKRQPTKLCKEITHFNLKKTENTRKHWKNGCLRVSISVQYVIIKHEQNKSELERMIVYDGIFRTNV